MLRSAFLAAFATVSAVVARDVTSSATRCTTRFGYYALPTGTLGSAAVPTWYRYTTTTNYFHITYTTRDIVTTTPSATTFTNVLTTTTTFSTTTTSTPAAITVPTPAGFLPLLAVDLVNPTPVPRIKRGEIEGRNSLRMLKRQTPANNTGGFSVGRDGRTSSLDRKFVQRVDCRVSVTVNSTTTTIVTGVPETRFVAAPTAMALTTTTISTTTTITQVLPRATVYQACAGNNVVSHITDFNGNTLVFDRVIYRPAQGFPIENELVVNTTSSTNCCIACQTTANCAGSFFAPSDQECHLRLTQRPAAQAPALPAPSAPASSPPYPYVDEPDNPYWYNASSHNYSTALTLFPTGALSVLPAPTSTGTMISNNNGTCASGSLSLYLGTIQGQEDFPIEFALSFSNGPCGRLSVWPVPVRDLDDRIEERDMKMVKGLV